MPYKKFPHLMVVLYLEANKTWQNVLPNKNAIYKTLNPIATVLEITKIYATHATLQTG